MNNGARFLEPSTSHAIFTLWERVNERVATTVGGIADFLTGVHVFAHDLVLDGAF